MHYKKKRTAKEKSTSFYLEKALLEKINLIAEFEGQSRSVIVETCINSYLKGGQNVSNDEFNRVKKRLYKKPKCKTPKSKKKFFISQENEQSLFTVQERQ